MTQSKITEIIDRIAQASDTGIGQRIADYRVSLDSMGDDELRRERKRLMAEARREIARLRAQQ